MSKLVKQIIYFCQIGKITPFFAFVHSKNGKNDNFFTAKKAFRMYIKIVGFTYLSKNSLINRFIQAPGPTLR